MKKHIAIGMVLMLVTVGAFAGCTSSYGFSGDVTGTLKSVELKGNDEIKVIFYNNSVAMFTFERYTDSGEQDWYFVLSNYIDKNIRLVWAINSEKIIVVSIEDAK